MKDILKKWWFYAIILAILIITITIIVIINNNNYNNSVTNNTITNNVKDTNENARTSKDYAQLCINMLESYNKKDITIDKLESDLQTVLYLIKYDYDETNDKSLLYLSYYIENIIYNINNNTFTTDNINADINFLKTY